MATTRNPFKYFEANLIKAINESFPILGIDCMAIASHQNGSEPTKGYCVINTLSLNSQGQADFDAGYVTWSEDDEQAYQYKNRFYEALVQIDFIGKDSDENAFIFYDSLTGNSVVNQVFQKYSLSSMRWSLLRRSPQKRGAVWIDSWSYDHTLGFAMSGRQAIDWVDVVIVNDVEITLNKEA